MTRKKGGMSPFFNSPVNIWVFFRLKGDSRIGPQNEGGKTMRSGGVDCLYLMKRCCGVVEKGVRSRAGIDSVNGGGEKAPK